MGNKSAKKTGSQEQTASVTAEVAVEKDPVKLYRMNVRKDSLLMLDPLSGIKRFIPIISDIDKSTIASRRKNIGNIQKSVSSGNVALGTGLMRKNPLKKHSSSSKDLLQSAIATPYSFEELDTPSLLRELTGNNDDFRVRRLDF